MMTRTSLVLFLLFCSFGTFVVAQTIDHQKPSLRYPEKIFQTSDGSLLYTANKKSGTISVFDLQSKSIRFEAKVATQIADAFLINDQQMLVIDDKLHQISLVSIKPTGCDILHSIDVAPYPAGMTLDKNFNVYVSSKWPRKVSKFNLDKDRLSLEKELKLPFAVRVLLPLEKEKKLLAADAFSGRLAIIDANTMKLDYVREFPAHNIRGMELSSDGSKVVFIHQMLSDLAVTNRNDIHWGLLMSNDARWLAIKDLLDPTADFYREGYMLPIGEESQGGGDPSSLTVTSKGLVAVTMAATSEFAVGKELKYGLYRTKVGRRPTDFVLNGEATLAYVANSYDDTISVVDIKEHEVIETYSLGPQRSRSLVEKGEVLFHKGLSMEGWMSCNSCHIDGHTNGTANDNFSDQSFGAPKRVLSLLGRENTAPFGWLGLSDSIESQVKKSVKQTMLGKDVSDDQASAIAAYIRTLEVPESIDQLQGTVNAKSVKRGGKLFNQLQCNNCHAPPLYTTSDTYDVGIHDKIGNKEFNPPSLRGIGHREKFFHDLSAESLEDVFLKHQHQLDKPLKQKQVEDLIAFLRSL